ncbi:MAG: hypothetical protein AAFV47_01485 [Pseudomonadota bacterium]
MGSFNFVLSEEKLVEGAIEISVCSGDFADDRSPEEIARVTIQENGLMSMDKLGGFARKGDIPLAVVDLGDDTIKQLLALGLLPLGASNGYILKIGRRIRDFRKHLPCPGDSELRSYLKTESPKIFEFLQLQTNH